MVRKNNMSQYHLCHPPQAEEKKAKTTDETATKMAKMEMGIGKSRSMYSIVRVVVEGHHC